MKTLKENLSLLAHGLGFFVIMAASFYSLWAGIAALIGVGLIIHLKDAHLAETNRQWRAEHWDEANQAYKP